MTQTFSLQLNESMMIKLAKAFGAGCQAPLSIYFSGDLGAGKTTFIRAFLQGLGISGLIKSPTYTLVETYTVANTITHHFDLYRLQDPSELQQLGLRDYFSANSIILIEWPEKAVELLPSADLSGNIAGFGTDREIIMHANTPHGQVYLQKLISLQNELGL